VKGPTLAEIMKATGWEAHAARGLVSILGSKGGETIESPKSSKTGERTYQIAKSLLASVIQTPPQPLARGGVPASRCSTRANE
jgi:hypothetical protein